MNLLKGTLIFLLLWEWLKPLPQIASFSNMSVLVAALALYSLVEMTRVRFLLKAVWKLVITAGATYYSFRGQVKTQPWSQYIKAQIQYSYQKVLEWNGGDITPFVRTLLFLLILWISVNIVYRSVLKNKQGIWFTLSTCAYLVLLDITTTLDIKLALVRVTVLSLLLLSFLQMDLADKHRTRLYWLSASILMVAMIASVAYAVPKPAETAAKPVDFLGGGNGHSIYQKVGYDSSDHRLGGPFVEDQTIVFSADTTSKQYWRAESRSIYTGSEWQASTHELRTLPLGSSIGLEVPNNADKKMEYKTKVKFAESKYDVVFYDGYPQEVKGIAPRPVTLYTTGNQDIKTKYNQNQHLQEYEVTEDIPIVNETKLRASTMNYPSDVAKEYLQLPITLPARVASLAKKVTENAGNPYDKALAIQDLLRNKGGYAYETDVPYLLPGQDFVDQFLFDTKKGYCDHFSTSMVVLLRTIGIPARYVKGFSPGELDQKQDGSMETIVRNKNAHSWVEAYFSDYGWVTFEPTPGFVNPGRKDAVEKQEAPQAVPASAPKPPAEPAVPDKHEMKDQGAAKGTVPSIYLELLLGVGAMVALFLLWKKRLRLRIMVLKQRGEKALMPEGVFEVYLSFLRLLGKRFSRRRKDESIREFVDRLSLDAASKEELRELTARYERYVYGKGQADLEQTRRLLLDILSRFDRINSSKVEH